MQKVFTAQTLLTVTHVKNLLAAANIGAEIRNEFAAGGVGELSFVDAWPELWVSYEDALQAKKIVSHFQAVSQHANQAEIAEHEWRCPCGETNGAAFASCWACHRDKPQ